MSASPYLDIHSVLVAKAAIAARFMHHLGQLTARADASER